MKTTNENHKKKFRGISLMVLIITVIVMIILASAVILMVVNKDTIDIAKEAALRTDMRTMLDNYDQRYREVLYGYQGDESKIKNSDFDGVVPDSYLDTGDYVAEKDGVRYQGDDERTKEIAKEMGLLVGNDGMLTGIDSVSVSDTTTSTAKAEVNLTGNPKGDFNYTYYVYDGTRWIVVGDSVAEGIYTIKNLKYNWSYKLKVEVSDNYDNTFTSDEVAFTTEELLIGRVILRLNDKNGSDYVPGEWTNQNVYIEAVQTDQSTETSYVVSGANTISRKTQVGSVLALQGESTATIITSDDANEVTSEAKILIDKENPTGSLELTSSTNSITARVMNPDDNLSGIKEFRYYIDGIIQATQNDPNYTFTTDIKQNTKYNIKVVIVDNAGNEGVIEKEVTTETVPSADNIVIEASPTDWTNGDVNVKIKYFAIPGMRVQYSKNGTDWEVIGNINTSGEYSTTVSDNNTTVYARYVDVSDQSGLSKTLTIQNIDKENPTIDSLVSEESPNSDLELILVGKATDNLSGIVAYQFSTDGNLNANSGGWTSITKTNSQITQRYTIYDNGTYYFYVKDLVGNVSKKEIVVDNLIKTFTITYNLNGGTDPGNPKEYTNKTDDFSLKNPTKTGYTFNYWVESQDGLSSQIGILSFEGNETYITESNGVYTMTNNRSGNTFSDVKIQIYDLSLNYIENITSHSSLGTYNETYTCNLETGTYYISISANGSTADSPKPYYRVNLEKGRTYNVGFTIDSFSATKAVASKFKFYRQGGNVTSLPVNVIQKGDTGNKTFTANWTINNYYIDLNTYLDGTWYEGSRVKVNLTVGGGNKGYVSDYYTAHPYGTAWSINGVQIDGTNVAYTASGTVGTSSVIIRIDFYTLTIARNNTSYGTTSASSLIALSGTTYSTSGSTLTMSDGRRVTASPTAATGYTTSFSSWSPSSATMNTTRTVTANFSRVINSYYLDLNLGLDGASYTGSRIKVNLTVGGSNKGYISDYWTVHPYGTSWSINGLQIDGVNLSYTASGTVGASTTYIPINFYTLTIARNNTSYGTTSASSVIVRDGTSYWTSGATLTLGDGRTVTASPTAATGYSTSFSSWSPSSAMISGGARTVTANFSRTGNTYYVAYNGNGATGGSTATSTHRYGTASNLRANGFVKNWPNGGGGTIRWSFRNWNRNAAGTSTSYSNRQSVLNLATSGTVTLYAQWSFNNATGVMGGSNDVNMRTGPGSGYANIGGSTWPTYAVRGANCTITNAAYQNYGSSGTLWLYVTCAARNLQVDTALGTKTGWVSGDYVRIN